VEGTNVSDKIVYWNKEVAELLKVGDSTLRKWCILFEERGYTFLKDEQSRRGFRDQDIVLLRRFRDLTKQAGMTLENAANAVLTRDESPDRTEVVLSKTEERWTFNANALKEYIERQEQFNQALVERLDEQKEHYESLLHKQQEYIENSIGTRDERLMDTIREIQEQRLLTAVAREEEQKKRSWWKFWK
jgi:DNA-binding transcriptional MerR regulator